MTPGRGGDRGVGRGSGGGRRRRGRSTSSSGRCALTLRRSWHSPTRPGFALRCANRIPHGRGLGSSAAAIVGPARGPGAGGRRASRPEAELALANVLEGHPDNVAPCLFGGLTIAWVTTGGAGLPAARAIRLDPHPEVQPVAFIAPGPVSTKVARGLLPADDPHADAVRNAGRAALLIAALTARPDALLDATEDKLHQDYRAPAMPHSHELVTRLRAAARPAVVSGAGPSVLALLPESPAQDDLKRLDSIAAETGIDWHISPREPSSDRAPA